MERLHEYLTSLETGPVPDPSKLESHLADRWDEFEGSGDGGMTASKLRGRMESVVWRPPVLTFQVERHGGTVLGSTRAEVQCWSVNFSDKTATLTATKRRQLTPPARRIGRDTMRADAERVADLIAENREDELIDWKQDGSVHVVVSRIIPGEGPKQTVAGRRKRFRQALEAALAERGWVVEGGNRFRRTASRPGVRAEA